MSAAVATVSTKKIWFSAAVAITIFTWEILSPFLAAFGEENCSV